MQFSWYNLTCDLWVMLKQVCGDGICAPSEYPGVGRFGCISDCGSQVRKTFVTRVHTPLAVHRGPSCPRYTSKKLLSILICPFVCLCIGTVTSVFSTAQSLSREGSRRSYSGRLGSGFNQCVLDIAWTCAGAEAKAPDLTRLACGSTLPQQRCGTGVARAGFRECHGRRRRADTLPSLKWDPFL